MKKIIFLGDSLTYAGRWEEYFIDYEISNHGIPGEKSFEIFIRLDEVLREKPDVIFLMMGINDLGDGLSGDVILDHYGQVIQKVKKESSASLFVQSILPVNFKLFPIKVFSAVEIKVINSMLKTLCEEEGVTFVDLYPSFSTYNDELVKEYTYDGLHLNESGYRIWKNCLQSAKLI